MRMRVKVRFCIRVRRVREVLGAVVFTAVSAAVRMRTGMMTAPAAGPR